MAREFPKPKRMRVYFAHKEDGDIVVFDGEHYRRQDAGPASSPLESFDEKQYDVVSRMREHDCEFGKYPWDYWREWAVADGVSEDLADLGRSLIREADQHNWPDKLLAECGWADNGKAMIEAALKTPEVVEKRWQFLLTTDGGRGYFDGRGRLRPMSDLN